MKKVIVVILLFALTSAKAQNEKYVAAMQQNLEAFKNAKTAEDFLDLSNAFERIAEAEKTQWLAFYYAAHTQVIYGYLQKDMSVVDPIANKAEVLINKADVLEQGNSEISCIKSMIAQLRMIVDPMQRWQQYGALATQLQEQAKQQDATNPRPYALAAQNLFYTPVQFGGGCTSAKPIAEEGLKLLNSFQPKSALHPVWGKTQIEMVLGQCK